MRLLITAIKRLHKLGNTSNARLQWWVKVEVKLSYYRPGHTLRAAGGWGFQNFYTVGTWSW